MRWILLMIQTVLILERNLLNAHNQKDIGTVGSESYNDNVLEDARLKVPGLIAKYGYPIEVHKVVTEDGYVLTLHRIPGGRHANDIDATRRVVYLFHGNLGASSSYVVLGPGAALAYILADEGYDVWMGNARGNFYSRRHTHLDPDKNKKYWKFSWDEIGILDLPVILDYIEEVTGQSQLHYIGHSQGATTFFVLCSLKPEYNEKIISFQGLAPAGSFEHSQSALIGIVGANSAEVEAFALTAGIWELYPRSEFLDSLATKICSPRSSFNPICQSILGSAFSPYLNKTIISSLLGHSPAGASVYQSLHYSQCFHHKKFRRYDHGTFTNLVKYGRPTPPEYDLSKVTAPVYIYYSDSDKSVHWKDAERLGKVLPNVRGLHKVEYPGWDHVDFLWAMGVKWRLYDKVIAQMRLAESRIN